MPEISLREYLIPVSAAWRVATQWAGINLNSGLPVNKQPTDVSSGASQQLTEAAR